MNVCAPKTTKRIACIVSILMGLFPVFAKAPTGDTAYAVLQTIKTPQQLMRGVLPHAYCVPLTLEGSLAQEMAASLTALNLPQPRYEEVFDKGQFSLRLANDAYAAQTRDLLSGILNPIAMIDMLLAGLVKYREPAPFNLLVKETVLQKSYAVMSGRVICSVHVRPRGSRFGYACEDRGGQVYETWLTAMECSIDTAAHLVTRLSLQKQVRLHGGDAQTTADSAYSDRFTYHFEYETVAGRMVPTFMSVAINDSPALKVRAKYRREQNALVFDTKEIYCRGSAENAPASLRMRYGAYRFGRAAKVAAADDAAPGKYAARLVNAARLARSAGSALNEGRIEAALDILRQLTQEYKGTPQAIEAEQLLQGLAPY